MNDFSFQAGSLRKGALAAAGAGAKYMVVPLLLISAASAILVDSTVESAVAQLGLRDSVNYILFLGVPIVILSFFRGFYPKGSHSRAAFGVIAAVLTGAWFWTVTLGGKLNLQFDVVGVSINFSGLVYLLLLAAALKAVYCVAELASYRREWLVSKGIRQKPKGRTAR